ncbi:hypothetical protein LC653_12715 [Nostoc sp. CHAB 5784]|uniref:hypothetical protein n=1 Tax=Nostoc mirabile TaxID=2907820 RepID=UPI001E3FCAF9|nr:hypothetical protein [Nostoc mirabile]MCC5664759.1 hypothetical protein [Nostoc mirabile CHAB5784]
MNTDRLDRIEEILSQTTTLAQANAAENASLRSSIGELRSSIGELRSTVNSLVQIVEVHQRNHEVSQRNFEVVMTEIRGLRTESQRILEHLFGREENRE